MTVATPSQALTLAEQGFDSDFPRRAAVYNGFKRSNGDGKAWFHSVRPLTVPFEAYDEVDSVADYDNINEILADPDWLIDYSLLGELVYFYGDMTPYDLTDAVDENFENDRAFAWNMLCDLLVQRAKFHKTWNS